MGIPLEISPRFGSDVARTRFENPVMGGRRNERRHRWPLPERTPTGVPSRSSPVSRVGNPASSNVPPDSPLSSDGASSRVQPFPPGGAASTGSTKYLTANASTMGAAACGARTKRVGNERGDCPGRDQERSHSLGWASSEGNPLFARSCRPTPTLSPHVRFLRRRVVHPSGPTRTSSVVPHSTQRRDGTSWRIVLSSSISGRG